MMVEGSNPVNPMTNPDSGTAFPAPENHPISDVDCNSLCSVEEFLAHMPETESVKCREFPRKEYDGSVPYFRVFWHPTGPNEPDPGLLDSWPLYNCYGVSGEQQSVETKIRFLLREMHYWESSGMFIQYWTHTKSSSGQSMLTVLEQPFGMTSMGTGFMDTRFCRYRYGCMKQAPIRVVDNVAGPLGRVFRRGSPEYSKQMEYYSREEFPLRDYAKFSGTYLALPIFEKNKCIGVLEFISTSSYGDFKYATNLKRLEGIGLTTLSRMHSHPEDCHKDGHMHISTFYKDVLHFVRIEQKLPLIQLWIPCFCDKTSRVTRLFCRWLGWGSGSCHNLNVKDENGWQSVENGKGLVGRAYSQKKTCFSGDTSQFSISEYPLVHLTRSRGLTACFAVPFKSLDPRLHDIILEVFLPPQENSDQRNVGIQLQSLLSAMAQNCQRSFAARCNGSVPFELEPDEEFCVQYSHSDGDNFVYFDVSKKHRYGGTHKALGNRRESHDFQPSRDTHDNQNRNSESSRESFSNSCAESLNGDQVQSREILGSSRIKTEQLSSSDQTPATANNGDSKIQGMVVTLREFADAAEKSEGHPMTNSNSSPAFPAPENHPIFKGDGVCSVTDFLAHINQLAESDSTKCQELPQKRYAGSPPDYRVFWHSTGPNQPDSGFMDSSSLYQSSGEKWLMVSVQTRIRSVILEMNYHYASTLFIQYWTHSKSSSGQSTLTVLKQPFRIGSMGAGFMDTRFCRYRYACMKQEIQVVDNLAGPVGRVFRQGSPEYSKQMEFYSREDFPLWDYAKFGGKYMALPIFEKEKCFGVLEFLSLASWNFQCAWTMEQLKSIGLTTLSHMHSHPYDCHRVGHKLLISTLYKDVLHFVRIEQKIPLIQLWIPCFCDKTRRVTRLFCRWTGWGSTSNRSLSVKDETNLANGWHSVENGKSLVGRAFSQKKSCFSGDTSQFSISEYPLAHLTRSRGLTACFAVPLRSLDPRLHDIILEVFLPPRENSDHGNVGIQLQSLLSAIFQNSQSSHAPRYNGSVPFKLKPDKKFCVQYSHSEGDNFVYFDVSQKYRSGDTCKALGNGRKGHDFQPSQKTDNDQNYMMLNRDSESSRESFSNSHADSLNGDQVQKIKKEQLSSPDHTPATVNSGDSKIQGTVETLRKFTDAAEKFEGRPHKRKELLNNQSASILQDTDFVEVGGKVTQEPEIGTFPNKRARENEALENGEISVMATYEDDTILFPLSCNSGIEELRKELEDAFQFGGQKFKVKYRHDNGIWITLLRDKDFRFHVESLKASRQSTVTLSVFSVSS